MRHGHGTLLLAWALGVGVATASPAAAANLAIEARATNPANGHEYLLTQQTYWLHAEIEAVKLGGHLATINDAAEQSWVYSTFGRYNNISRLLWIGLSDGGTEGQFRWVSGQTTSYTNWASGEPNNASNEDYVAMYYPGHSQQGKWNDWGQYSSDPIGIPMHAVIELEPGSPSPFFLETDTSWQVTAPVGNLQNQPIGSVGAAWEAAHPGWNHDLGFDTAGWQSAVPVGQLVWAPTADTPAYLRKTFYAPGPVGKVMMLVAVDDDAQVYLNGQLVLSDGSGGPTHAGPLDVTAYIVPGLNLVAVKAQDSGGSNQAFRMALWGTVPEPATLGVIAAGAVLLAGRRRQGWGVCR